MINKSVWNVRGNLITVKFPCVMGIINVNDNSFYFSSRVKSEAEAVKRASKMITEGAVIIDIGAASTKPGSELIDAKSEMNALKKVFISLRREFPDQLFSIDTYNSETVRMAYDFGMDIINDISSGSIDHKMLQTVGNLKMPYIAMHMLGTPVTMQQNPEYNKVSEEIIRYFSTIVKRCTEAGISDIVIDPGFGFGKTIEQNYQLLNDLSLFNTFQFPILAGISRKSMLYRALNITAEGSANATTVANTIALIQGADILRVHDVRQAFEAIEVVKLTKATRQTIE